MIELGKMDKSHFSIRNLHDPSDDKEFWLSKTPEDRMQALQYMRQMAYGYDPTKSGSGIQRFFEVVKCPWC